MTVRAPGRPRDTAADTAILRAAVEELVERGFIAASMESVAARAGVAKTTVYRRYAHIGDLAVAAMAQFEEPAVEPAPGSVRDQLVELVDRLRRKWGDPTYAAMMRRVAADGSVEPEKYRRSRDRLIGPHLALMLATIRRGIDEGVIRDDVDPAFVRQLLSSPVIATSLTVGQRMSRAQIELIVDTVLAGLRPA